RVGNRMVFHCADGARISCRLIEGEFPNWRGLLPSTCPHVIHVVDPKALPAAIKEVAWAAQDATPVRIIGAAGAYRLHALTQDVGQAGTVAPSDVGRSAATVACGPAYQCEMCADCGAGPVTFAGIGPLKPWLVRARWHNGEFRGLLMPVRVA